MLQLEDFQQGQVLLFDKEKEWTSFDLVNKTRNILRKQFNIKKIKVGHAGTLDPLATGLMIVCTGKQTKSIDQYQGLDKSYITTMKLGEYRPSFDLETPIEKIKAFDHINLKDIEQTLSLFSGEIQQVPPMFSAINVNGKRAYQLAREGKEVKLKSKTVHIHSINILEFNAPFLSLEIVCSKGTYIRSLARDISDKLDTYAHLTELRRTQIGHFSVDQATDIKTFEQNIFNHL